MRKIVEKQAKIVQSHFFWRVYGLEQKIGQILSYRIDLPSFRTFSQFLAIVSLIFVSIPQAVHAQSDRIMLAHGGLEPINPVLTDISAIQKNGEKALILPYSPDKEPNRIKKVFVTFYSSTTDQTDGTPFITANGTYVYDGIVAANMLPFGTRLRFPDLYGDKLFTVQDRMNRRYTNRIDIWVASRDIALKNGFKYTTIEIY